MLFRFSLYGFLKNQQYYEPFLLLVLLEKGLSFTQIGLLIGFREICINVMEIPTGAIADVAGRRRSMILSFLAYIASFLIFAFAQPIWTLLAAMLLFSLGEAFRTGTHKAIIFDWLNREGRADEKTRVYGYTRSWSKIGSAVSAVIAAGLVFATGRFSSVFVYCTIPYALGIINFMGYPSYLDGPADGKASIAGVLRTLYDSFGQCVKSASLRRLLTESMCFEGTFKVCKDYLQTIIRSAALVIPLSVLAGYSDAQRTAVLAAPIFLVLYLLGSWASRHAHVLADRAGGEDRGAAWLWWAYLAMFAVIAGASSLGVPSAAIPAFVALALVENFWRPILVSRFADHADPARQATVLSIESQGKSFVAAGMAPLLGLAVDHMPADMKFLPVGLVGVLVASAMILTSGRVAARK